MKNLDFINKAKDIALNYKTLYVMGGWGQPLNDRNKAYYINKNSYNKQTSRANKIKSASSDTFGFDCVCLIKGILWGWIGDKNKTNGGATYGANGVADKGADTMITSPYSYDISANFSNIIPGEVVWMSGHIGIYIGNGLVVEASPKWQDKVQITALGNIGSKKGYNSRTWTKHAKLKYIEYDYKEGEEMKFKVGDYVYALEDIKLYTSVLHTENLYTIKKGEKAYVKLENNSKGYQIALANPDTKVYFPSAWTDEIDKLTIEEPGLDYKSLYEKELDKNKALSEVNNQLNDKITKIQEILK